MATTNRPARAVGPDRLTVAICTFAAILAVLALLAWQFRAASGTSVRPVVLVRRVYETRVIETVPGSRAGASSVTQSVSSSGGAVTAAPTSGTSGR